MTNNLCPACEDRPKQKHFNSKWCVPCSKEKRTRPASTMTKAEISQARKLIGKMSREDIAAKIGVSISSLKRAFRGTGLTFFNKHSANPEMTKRVCAYYSKHGRVKTEKKFPKLCVRSIVERYPIKPRKIRWSDDQIVLAAKMAGLVEGKRQAKIFNRPGANEGSIKSLWVKRFKTSGGNVHGMSEWMARQILKPGYPVIKTQMWSKRKGSKNNQFERGIILWCDMESHLLRNTPKFIRDGVKTMAQFQCWLFDFKNPKREILKLLASVS